MPPKENNPASRVPQSEAIKPEDLQQRSAHSAPDSEREIVSTRIFPVQRERVFAAFSDAQQLSRWWGPKGFTSTFDHFDLRPGGTWRLILHGPDGRDYPNEKRFIEVAAPERIVCEHVDPVHHFVMTMIFTEREGGTALAWRMLFDTADHVVTLKKVIAEANEQNFDRLAAHLAQTG